MACLETGNVCELRSLPPPLPLSHPTPPSSHHRHHHHDYPHTHHHHHHPPHPTHFQAVLRVLHNKAVKEVSVHLRSPRRLIPVHINNAPPSYYILGGLVFTPVTVPLLRSEYGKVGFRLAGVEACV